MIAVCVDDEGLILARTVSLVKKTNIFDNVESFMDPTEALEFLDTTPADLALLDIDMPEISGLELASKMQKKCPGIKIIFLTGYSEYAVDAYAMHATGYLLKPVNYERLLEELNYALESKRAEVKTVSLSNSSRIKVETFGYFFWINFVKSTAKFPPTKYLSPSRSKSDSSFSNFDIYNKIKEVNVL